MYLILSFPGPDRPFSERFVSNSALRVIHKASLALAALGQGALCLERAGAACGFAAQNYKKMVDPRTWESKRLVVVLLMLLLSSVSSPGAFTVQPVNCPPSSYCWFLSYWNGSAWVYLASLSSLSLPCVVSTSPTNFVSTASGNNFRITLWNSSNVSIWMSEFAYSPDFQGRAINISAGSDLSLAPGTVVDSGTLGTVVSPFSTTASAEQATQLQTDLSSIKAAVCPAPGFAPFWQGFGVGLLFASWWVYRRLMRAATDLNMD